MAVVIELFLLTPENIPNLAEKTGISEENLQHLYEYDQIFSLATKICVIDNTTDVARLEVKNAVEEWFSNISLDDLFQTKRWVL